MPSPRRRLAAALLGSTVVALVAAPAAAALRFTDASRMPPTGAVGSPYRHHFEGLGGCGPALPYQYRVLNGSLPPGLSLSSGGVISGTPRQQGRWAFWVELSDEDPPSAPWCRPAKSEEEFVIEIGPPGTATAVPAQPTSAAGGGFSVPTVCDIPGPAFLCDAVGGLAGGVAGAAGDFVMRGVTVWVTNAAVWVTGKVGELIDATASPDVEADWFVGQYQTMLGVAGLLALPMLLLAVIQALLRQDIWILLRSAFGYLPMAFILAGAAIVGTALLVSITDDLSAMVTSGLGDGSRNLLQSVGDAYSTAIEDDSDGAVPLFGVFLGAIILAIGAFVLWLEMVIRDAAIYIALFFLPLTFVAMIWPATSRYARRLVEFLVAVVLAKLVIVAIIGLASAAITNGGAGGADGQVFERMIAGAALLVLAAWSPFALLRLIPMMEIAAASVVSQRSSMSGAAGSAGIHSPASYMRQAMDRHSRPSASPAYAGMTGTMYARVDRSAEASPSTSRHETRSESGRISERTSSGGGRSGQTSGGPGGATSAPPVSRPEPRPQPAPPQERRPEPPSQQRRPPQPPLDPPSRREGD